MTNLPQSRQADIVVRELENETLIYDLTINKAYMLNQTSTIIYQACDGKTTLDEVKQRHKFTDEIIFLALDELQKINLIAENQIYISPLAGMKRRDVIKRVGLASMAMLPIISSIVAPSAAMAASGSSIALFGICPSVSGPGCAAGTHCTNCLAGCPNGNGPTCCANSHPTVSRGPGQPTISSGDCNTESTCAALGPAECCKGTAKWTFNGCGGIGAGGTCICD